MTRIAQRSIAAVSVLAVALGLVLSTAGGVAAAKAGKVPEGPSGEAFYAPPDPLSKGKPGTLIRAQPADGPAGATTWRVLYHSRSVAGDDIAVSGLIVVPDGPKPLGGRPIVTWGHGTTGLADVCTPSKDSARALTFLGATAEFIDAGYVIAATDYEGLGTPGLHPYLVGISEGRGMLDAARAARNLKKSNAGRDVLSFGHSQGGHAALFAAELAKKYAPDLHMLGVAAVAPAADLEAIVPLLASVSGVGGYFVMSTEGFDAAYPGQGFESVLTPDAASKADIVNTACSGDVGKAFNGPIDAIVATNPLETPAFKQAIHDSSAGNSAAGAPLLIAQGDQDRTVPKPLTDAFAQKVCTNGESVDYRVYPGAGHGPVIVAAKNDIVSFFATLVKGDAVSSTCP